MKNKFLKSLILILCLPIVMVSFCACSKKPLDANTYFIEVRSSVGSEGGTMASITMDDITASNPNMDKVNNYYEFDITAQPEWIYKMFIENITFNIFTYNKLANVNEVTFTLTITNAIAESDVGKDYSNDLTDEDKIYTETRSIIPTENGRFELSFDVNRVLGFANGQTGSMITIDISEYAGGIASGNIEPLQWILYGFRAYGESRTYN